jgi:hypothetical protein
MNILYNLKKFVNFNRKLKIYFTKKFSYRKLSLFKVACGISRSYKNIASKDLCPNYIGFTRLSDQCITFLNCKYEFQPEAAKAFIIENNRCHFIISQL